MTDIFSKIDEIILYKRKKNYSLKEILYFFSQQEPYLDEMLCLVHIVRVCFENNLPFSESQIKRIFNKIYKKEFHGSKQSSWEFLQQWSSNKIIKFKSDPFLKVASTPQKNKQSGGNFELSGEKSNYPQIHKTLQNSHLPPKKQNSFHELSDYDSSSIQKHFGGVR